MKNIKVQLPREIMTAASMIESGVYEPGDNRLVTFIAYSQKMKARVLESLASGVRLTVTLTDEPARDGEWLEAPVPVPPPAGQRWSPPA